MNISFIDICNFRKLEDCRIELSQGKTIFVGANNSGKTSAMDALRKFLIGKTKFIFNDIFIAKRKLINEIGNKWNKAEAEKPEDISDWCAISPTLDIWLKVDDNEIQYVAHIIPTLRWRGGLIGVRFVFQPSDIEKLFIEYRQAHSDARSTEESNDKKELQNRLWPKNLCDFLEKELNKYFGLKSYILDPYKFENGEKQNTSDLIECLTNDPLKGLIKISMIPAQRGFSDVETQTYSEEKIGGSLSSQLRSYYDKHLDPEKSPTPEDLDTLVAMESATNVFNNNLQAKFEKAIGELQSLGYPGVADPKITIATKVSAIETLRHDAAVNYSLNNKDDAEFSLPEKYNGLGYQNLISIVFQLMRFRDDWVREGKAKNYGDIDENTVEPIHLVLLEEPEAHLHVQVQQVLIRQALGVLHNSDYLRKNKGFSTQLVVSTHSSHIAKECPFENLRYFKRIAPTEQEVIGTSKIINLSDVFGKDNETARFVSRYLQTTHCDLFFADAAILIEGTAEEMLLPHFISHKFPELRQRYLSILRIMGRHMHTLSPLLDKLAIPTLVIADLDTGEGAGRHCKVPAERSKSQICTNYTINTWIMEEKSLDILLDKDYQDKVISVNATFPYSIRVAYQKEIDLNFNDEEVKAIPRTFEDSLIYTNLSLFLQKIEEYKNQKTMEGTSEGKIEIEILQEVFEAINSASSLQEFHTKIFDVLKKSSVKASFALDLMYEFDPAKITIPEYIGEGLNWLQEQLKIAE